MVLAIVIMIIISLAILLGSHVALYYSFVNFFNLTDGKIKLALLLILLFLSLSFILSLILTHFWENSLTRGFYDLTAFWLGLALNLLMAALAVSILIWLGQIFKFSFNLPIISSLVFLIALIFTIYGAWNAMHPVVKKLEVKINNLPPAWQNKVIVQLSDMHLGYVHREKFLKQVIDKVNQIKPDLVVITGDLFDGMDGQLTGFASMLDEIKAPLGIYFITGNHETYLGTEKIFSLLNKTKIKILDNQVVDLASLQLIGASYPMFGENKHIKKIIMADKNYVYGRPTILLYHTPANLETSQGGKVSSQLKVYFYPTTEFSAAQELGVNLQLSGHTHQGQLFPVNILARWVYNGYEYGLRTFGNFNIYTSSGVGTWGPPIRLANKPEIVAIKLK